MRILQHKSVLCTVTRVHDDPRPKLPNAGVHVVDAAAGLDGHVEGGHGRHEVFISRVRFGRNGMLSCTEDAGWRRPPRTGTCHAATGDTAPESRNAFSTPHLSFWPLTLFLSHEHVYTVHCKNSYPYRKWSKVITYPTWERYTVLAYCIGRLSIATADGCSRWHVRYGTAVQRTISPNLGLRSRSLPCGTPWARSEDIESGPPLQGGRKSGRVSVCSRTPGRRTRRCDSAPRTRRRTNLRMDALHVVAPYVVPHRPQCPPETVAAASLVSNRVPKKI